MKNLKAFAKANETLTKEALLTVKGGDGETCRPSSVTKGGTIEISVESSGS
jgi:hypothetical protein